VSLEIGVNGPTTDGHGRPDEQPENKTLSAYFCWRGIKAPQSYGTVLLSYFVPEKLLFAVSFNNLPPVTICIYPLSNARRETADTTKYGPIYFIYVVILFKSKRAKKPLTLQ